MTIIHSSDLGWKAGQDISQEFAALAKTFKPGDVFVFDHMYEISGSKIQLPDNFTLAGGAIGAGIDVIDTATNSAPLIFLGNQNTVLDLTVKHSNTPQTKTTSKNAQSGVDYHIKRTFVSDDKNDVKILNSYFEGNSGIFLEIIQGSNLLVQDTEFNGGYYQVRLGADVNSPTFHNNLHQNSLGDGIKTLVGSNARHTKDATISDSVFINNLRDGLDTTGGFKDSIVTNSYFVNNGVTGIDLKEGYNTEQDFAAGGPINQNILITNSEFIDNPSAIVVTTLDRGDFLTTENAKKWAIQDIWLKDSVVEDTSPGNGYSKMFLVKDSHDIHWENVALLGDVQELKTVSAYNIGLPTNVNGTGLTTGDYRTPKPDSYYQNMAGPDWSSITFAADGSGSGIVDPIVIDPISYTPPPSDPADDIPPPSEPEPVDIVGASASEMLNIYLADTNTDQTLLQIGDGAEIDLNMIEGKPVTIYAKSQDGAPAIGSVRLDVAGFGSAIENVEPFALFGDSGGDFLGGKTLSKGIYPFTMTAYEGKNGSGKVLETVTFDFSVSTSSTPVVEQPAPIEPSVVVPIPEPETDPTPIVEQPAPEPVSVVENTSNLLNIYIADTKTDKTLGQIGEGTIIDQRLTDGKMLTIYATTQDGAPAVGSIKIKVPGFGWQKTENVEPFALFGDKNGDFLGGKKLPAGTHNVVLTAYEGKNNSGKVLETISFDFTVGEASMAPASLEEFIPNPVLTESVYSPPIIVDQETETDIERDMDPMLSGSALVNVSLIDTDTDQIVANLYDGIKISSSLIEGRKLTISAEAVDPDAAGIGSMKLDRDGNYSGIENVSPYALFGDENGDFLDGEMLFDGEHFTTLTAYSGKNGTGSVLEQVTLNFSIGDYDSVVVDGISAPVSSYSTKQDAGRSNISNDQSSIELEASAWKSLSLYKDITELTIMKVDFKSNVEGEIQGIGFSNGKGSLTSTFFQLDGLQEFGIQDFNDMHQAGTGFETYTIPVGQYFTGDFDQLVLVNDDDAGFGSSSSFDNISFFEAVA